uniref:Trypsin-like peptidase domain-containing protein n=1 Tax=Candidatus Kentrum sp. UNK TaxID=2126344 RepID=A0A451ASR0_9GAMM|nr:MAG: Trypsin-like peptidase domain-containing protein [Candidatus Kentron sp. UNK]VFK69084.1 MAG: Trypsin-like peptidase domain-containing protein [Candidatus Kentron sp. UNK]
MVALETSLWQRLERCTATIGLPNGGIATGTLIGPGLLVTCAHAIPQDLSGITLRLADEKVSDLELIGRKPAPYPDLAILRFSHLEHSWVFFQGDVHPGDRIFCFGYTDKMSAGDSVTGEVEGWSKTEAGELLKFKGGQVRPGLSGAPLLNYRTDAVCGIVRTSRDRSSDLGGRAIPADIVTGFVTEQMAKVGVVVDFSVKKDWNTAKRCWSVDLRSFSKKNPWQCLRGALELAEHFKGRKKELVELGDFWEGEQVRVLALVGIGGAGKTALVRRFLDSKNWLDQVDFPPPDIDSLFIWSFYDYPSTSDFLAEAYEFFRNNSSNGIFDSISERNLGAGNAYRLIESLRQSPGRNLLVLDGLEKMQSPGIPGESARGALEDPPLRHLMMSVVDGQCGSTKIIVTTRFPLTDLSARPNHNFWEQPLNELDRESAMALLRSVGVHGSTASIIREFGRHALTLDLLGRFLHTYFEGDAQRAVVLPALNSVKGETGIEKQSARLSRVLSAYQKYLSETELLTLQKVSLFRRPIESQFLADLFLGSAQEDLAGKLASLRLFEFEAELRILANLRLVIFEQGQNRTRTINCHPAVRDYFYGTIGETEKLHLAIRERIVSLVDAPKSVSHSEGGGMDLLEELIYHTVMLEKREEAFQIYRERLGYLKLGWEKGDHVRGVAVLRMIGEGPKGSERSSWSEEQALRFGIDYSLYLKNLGALDESIQVLSSLSRGSSSQCSSREKSLEEALVKQNLSAVLVLRGWLPIAENSARDALKVATAMKDARMIRDCRVRFATALAMQGNVLEAEKEFCAALRESALVDEKSARDVLAVRYAWLMYRIGKISEAEKILTMERERYRGFQFGIIVARLEVVLVEVLARQGKLAEGKFLLEGVLRWTVESYDEEMAVAAQLAGCHLAIAEGDMVKAKEMADEGLYRAEKFGYGTYWLDLTVLLSRVYLSMGDYHRAHLRAENALVNGAGNALPIMLGSVHEKVGYLWAEADARELCANALAKQQDLENAVAEMQKTVALRDQLKDPRSRDCRTILQKWKALHSSAA